VLQEWQDAHETTLKQQGAVDALQSLTRTLTALILRDDIEGNYFFGMHDALEVVKRKLDIMQGGVA
jgi:hypothetical protein